MLIRVGYDIVFEHPAPTLTVAMLYLHPACEPKIRRDEYLLVDPAVQVAEYVDGFGNRCGRFVSPAGRIRLWNDAVVEDGGEPDRQEPNARQHEIHELRLKPWQKGSPSVGDALKDKNKLPLLGVVAANLAAS